jgi:hypothetical protein
MVTTANAPRRGTYVGRILSSAAGSSVKKASNFVKGLRRTQRIVPPPPESEPPPPESEPLELSPSTVQQANVAPQPEPQLENNKYTDAINEIVTKNITLSLLMRSLTEKKGLLITQCQAIGGFNIDKDIKVDIDDIYKRLGKIASVNLVALSEAGDYLKAVRSDHMRNGLIAGMETASINGSILDKIDDKFDDTVFIYKDFKESDKPLEFNFSETTQPSSKFTYHKPINNTKKFSNLKYINSSGINILNVHLPSSGPEKLENIDTFLKDYLPTVAELNETNVNIIVGDTNITCSKCGLVINDGNRKLIMQKMLNNVIQIYGDEWALLMSTTYVNKYRSYGILLNQQPIKSTVKGEPEPDGTAIFIKIKDKSVINTEFFSKNNFGQGWILLCNDTFYMDGFELSKLNLIKEIIPTKFLQFDTPSMDCLDTTNGILLDKLFIDHTPVQISFDAIKIMTGIQGTVQTWKNLVVLNAGSITNSTESKNWKLNILKCMDEIKEIDKELYEGMYKEMKFNKNLTPEIIDGKKYIFNGESGDYDKIIGEYYGNWKINFDDKQPYGIHKDVFASLLNKADDKLSKLSCFPPPPLGTKMGGSYTKKIKSKRVKKQ